jgi:hypothetical protein
MQSDQRKTQRFDLRLPMEVVRRGAQEIGKATETRNLSSGGVLFAFEAQLQIGEPIEYFITLPAGGRGDAHVRLHCVGTVIRAENRNQPVVVDKPFSFAATMERYEFVRR